MPLLIDCSAKPLLTPSLLHVTSVYAIIDTVFYSRQGKNISAGIGYYTSEAACDARAEKLVLPELATTITQLITPDQANSAGMLQVLESLLLAGLVARLGEEASIVTLP